MDYTKPTLLVISGPNGAGKSTHIQTMLPDAFGSIYSFDRDNTRLGFEKQIEAQGNIPEEEVFGRATRMMEDRLIHEMKEAIILKKHFVLETPLSHPDYWVYIDLFEQGGYQIQLNYLCLDKVSNCIARVAQRVLEGGHYVAPNTIKGVYDKNLEHINNNIEAFKLIELYDGMIVPTLLVTINDGKVTYADEDALKKRWIKSGLTVLYPNIKAYLNSR